MRLWIIVTMLLLACGCAPPPAVSIAQSEPACQLPFPGVAKLKARGVRVVEVAEPSALVELYNSTEPVSDLQPDKVYLIRRGADAGIVALVVGECILGHIPITDEVMALLDRGGA